MYKVPLLVKVEKKMRQNYWPIPEEYLNYNLGLPPRQSNPKLCYNKTQFYGNLKTPNDFPYDCYKIIPTKSI